MDRRFKMDRRVQDGGDSHAENHCRNSDYFMH